MTDGQTLALVAAIAGACALVATVALARAHRTCLALLSSEQCGALKPVFFASTWPTECILRPRHRGSHADEHGTRWRRLPSVAKDGEVCGAYRVPSAAEDSGLCAGCGMSDYKHQEQQ